MEMMAGAPEYSIFLDDCRCPRPAALGKEGAGWEVAFGTLDTFPVSVGAACWAGEASFEEAFSYARKATGLRKPISDSRRPS